MHGQQNIKIYLLLSFQFITHYYATIELSTSEFRKPSFNKLQTDKHCSYLRPQCPALRVLDFDSRLVSTVL